MPKTNLAGHDPYTIHHLVERQAEIRPHKTAIVFFNQTLSYAELNSKANQFARYLIDRQVKPGDIVPIISSKSPLLLIAILGILKAGAAYSPLNDDSPSKHLEAVVKETRAKYVCVESRLMDRLTFESSAVIKLDQLDKYICSYSEENVGAATLEADLAYVIYTSGTTGNPKGGMISHANLLPTYFSWEEEYGLNDSYIHLQMAPVGFDVFTGDWIRALCSGGKLILCPKSTLIDAKELYQLIQKEKVNCAEFVPAILRQLIAFIQKNNYDLSQFRLLVCGSDQWRMGEYRAVKKLCGAKTRVISSYGLTETTIDSSFYEESSEDFLLDDKAIVPIGKPFKHVNIYLVNDDKLVPPGKTGEIYIGGSGVGLGYLNQPNLTAERFLTTPPSSFGDVREKLYRTGDQGEILPDGNFLFYGRNQEIVKIHGKRVDLPSLEAVINQHPKIKFAIVIPEKKYDQVILKCFFTLKNDSIAFEELTTYIKDHLACYYVPREFYQVETIPLSLNGKVDRRIPSQKIVKKLKPEIQLPKDEIQIYLINLWKKILKTEEVGIATSFYDLGGSSLTWVEMLTEVNKKFNLNITPTVEIETIEELTKHIVQQKPLLFQDQPYPLPSLHKENYRYLRYTCNSANFFYPLGPCRSPAPRKTTLPKPLKRSLSYLFEQPKPLQGLSSLTSSKPPQAVKTLLSLAFRKGR